MYVVRLSRTFHIRNQGELVVNKTIRTLVLAVTILAGFAATSHAGLCTAPVPVPAGTPR